MAQWVKAIATKPDNLSLIPEFRVVKRERGNTHTHAHVCMHTNTHEISVK